MYTIAGTRAVGVNVIRRIDQVPLGVYAGEGKGEVTLTIEGIGDWAETLYLYDAVTRKVRSCRTIRIPCVWTAAAMDVTS